tara:strand:+ start:2360 stop:3055 length:696 start_codon:yes stop_codon:yes gene_type:complete
MLMAGDDIVDAEWEEVPGNGGKVEMLLPKLDAKDPQSERRQAEDADRSAWLDFDFWRSLPWGKGLLIAAALLTLFAIMDSLTIEDGSTSAEPDDDQQDASPVDTEQMLSDWSQFATGKASTAGFTLIDGEGKPGEFCNSATGASMMNFGNQTVANTQLYDFFSWLPDSGNVGIAGAFQFDATTGQLLAIRLIQGDMQTDRHQSIDDITMQVLPVAPGVVDIEGTRYHECVL